jgi:CheY-like chemotaxis protein
VKKVLLVCAGDCSELEDLLSARGCNTATARNGAEALHRMKHQPIDLALLVSTSKDMDAAEIALNLTDINPRIDIIILLERRSSEHLKPDMQLMEPGLPQTRFLSFAELSEYLAEQPTR